MIPAVIYHRTAVTYCRVSSLQQKRDATIETQIATNEEYCRNTELSLEDRYYDDGISGTLPFEERPEGKRLLEDARAGKFKVLVIYDLDRLGRDDYAITTPLTISLLRGLGIEIHTPRGKLEDTPEGNLMLGIQANLASYYRAQLLRRTKDGKLRTARDGRWCGGVVPFGYRLVDGRLTVNEDTAPVVRRIFAEIAGGCTAVALTVQFNAEGVLGSHAWYCSRLCGIIRNTVYRGEHTYASPEGSHTYAVPPLVEVATWWQANEALGKNRWSGPPAGVEFLFRGLIRCGVCGSKFYCNASRENNKSLYRCGARRDPHSMRVHNERCENPSRSSARLDRLAWENVLDQLQHPDQVIGRVREQLRRDSAGVGEIKADAERVRAEIAGMNGQADVILRMLRRGAITPETAERQLAELAGEEKALRTRLGEIEARIAAVEGEARQLTDVEGLLKEISGFLGSEPGFESKRRAVLALVETVTVYPDGEMNIRYKY